MTTYRIYGVDDILICEGEAESFKSFVEQNKSNLYKADLRDVNLKGANLDVANLEGANLRGANLRGASLWSANLRGAFLWNSDLEGSDFRDSDFRSANLEGANLRGADLWGASLWSANLRGSDFRGANLTNSNLTNANLEDATLDETFITIYNKHRIGIKLPNSDIQKQNISEMVINIGCETKTLSEWDEWFSGDEEFETKRGSFEFRQIQGMYEAYRAYIMRVWGENE